MSQAGEHTWDMFVHYHRCPRCGYIIESRQQYEYKLGEYLKELTCNRCDHEFIAKRPSKPTFGPLIGEDQPAEFDWR